nr:hypothetical protein GCM10020092_012760 [Actinoplanes digitatis]
MRRPLVVQRPRLGVGAHGERAAGYQHLAGDRDPGGRRRFGVEHGRAVAQLVGGEHGLVVLLLVLDDHAEREAVRDQRPPVEADPVEHVEGLVPHLVHIGAGLGRAEQRQRRAVAARVLEGVVQLVDVAAHRLPAADVPDQPELLLVGDVREVPDQG